MIKPYYRQVKQCPGDVFLDALIFNVSDEYITFFVNLNPGWEAELPDGASPVTPNCRQVNSAGIKDLYMRTEMFRNIDIIPMIKSYPEWLTQVNNIIVNTFTSHTQRHLPGIAAVEYLHPMIECIGDVYIAPAIYLYCPWIIETKIIAARLAGDPQSSYIV